MKARESWLRSEDPERFAAAAVKCSHAGGFCMSDGYCHYDGRCFRSGYAAMAKACQLIEAVAGDEPSDIAEQLRHASGLLRQSWKVGQEEVKEMADEAAFFGERIGT